MPTAAIISANSGHYREPHEHGGPWHDYELSDSAETLHRAHKISKNEKLMKAVNKHAHKRAGDHLARATHIRNLMRAGKISEKAAKEHE